MCIGYCIIIHFYALFLIPLPRFEPSPPFLPGTFTTHACTVCIQYHFNISHEHGQLYSFLYCFYIFQFNMIFKVNYNRNVKMFVTTLVVLFVLKIASKSRVQNSYICEIAFAKLRIFARI